MPDDNDPKSERTNREETFSAIELAYKAALRNLITAGDHLSDIAEIVDLLDDGEYVNLPFLLSRQLEVVRISIKWVSATSKNLKRLQGANDDDAN